MNYLSTVPWHIWIVLVVVIFLIGQGAYVLWNRIIKKKIESETEWPGFKQAFTNFKHNLWLLLVNKDVSTTMGVPGPQGATGPMGTPADLMFRSWKDIYPDGDIEGFGEWFKKILRSESIVVTPYTVSYSPPLTEKEATASNVGLNVGDSIQLVVVKKSTAKKKPKVKAAIKPKSSKKKIKGVN